MTIQAELQEIEHLDNDQGICARAAKRLAEDTFTLDVAEARLRLYFPGWFVYRGGHHIAMHLKSGDPRRVLFVTEVR